jgi:acetyl esterase/lipase
MPTFLDIPFAAPDGEVLKADLYLPDSVDAPPPVILFLHGGGWRFGDRKLAPDLQRYFASQGFAMASIDYRLSTVAPFPAAVEDVKTGIRWLRSVADQYGVDASQLGIWGSSAGAHLGALAALSGSERFAGDAYAEYSSDVQALVDGYGPTDFLRQDEFRDPDGKPSDDPESIQLPAGKRSTDPDSLESLFIGAPILEVPDQVAQANPISHIRPQKTPFLILHGLSDTAVPWQQSEMLYNALAQAGCNAELVLIEGLGHGFFNRNDLDERGPFHLQYRNTQKSDEVLHQTGYIFPMVAEFFGKTLTAKARLI